MVSALASSLLVLLLPFTALGAFVQRSSGQYDYIVVGGGAAGCIVASRLSEDHHVSVLLIEAGPTNEGLLNVEVPYNFNKLFPNTPYDWNFTITAQPGLNNRSLPYIRGRMLGGSTSVNGMTYTRGPSSDWDRIASYLGDASWTWDALQPFMRKNEAFEIPPGNPDDRFDPRVHGFGGEIATSLNEETEWINPPSLAAANASGYPYNRDVNSGSPLGVSWEQFSIKDGVRSSAATAYINQQARTRRNLHVLVDTKVNRVIPEAGSSPLKFTTVEYVDASGATAQAVAKRDIIISSGTMNGPPLLMRSGLGDPEELQAAGITPVFTIPALGKNLIDHVGLPLAWTVNTTLTDDTIERNVTLYNELLAQWNQSHTGRLTQTGFSHLMYSRLPADASIFQTTPDASSGPVAPHYEQLLVNKWTGLVPRPPTGNFVGMTHFVVYPTSTGTVKLNPADPQGHPLIDPRYLTTDWDMFVMRAAIRRSIAYMNTPVWQQWNATPVFDPSVADTDESLDAFIRAHAFGGVHCVATAKIGPANSPAGSDVVGPDFRVKGVKGLRIVDASVIPFIPGAHTMAPVYILAEKASDVIKRGQ